MDVGSFVASCAVILSGVGLGAFSGWIAEEELAPGEEYLLLLSYALFVAIIGTVVWTYASPLYLLLGALVCITFFALYVRIPHLFKVSAPVLLVKYLFFLGALMLVLNKAIFLLTASLIFLYGFPVGSLAYGYKTSAI